VVTAEQIICEVRLIYITGLANEFFVVRGIVAQVLRSGFMPDAGSAGRFELLSRAAGVMIPIVIEGEAPAIEPAASSCGLVEHGRMRLDTALVVGLAWTRRHPKYRSHLSGVCR
jgi:hypothetical protein